jgi:hypothetical protein
MKYTGGHHFDSGSNPEVDSMANTIGLSLPLNGKAEKTILFLPLEVVWFEGDSSSPESPDLSITELSAGLRIIHLEDKGKISLIQLMCSTILNNGSSSDIYIHGNALMTFPYSEGFKYLLGVFYSPEIINFPLPVAGIRWNQVKGPWSLDIILPQRILLSYNLSDSLRISSGLSSQNDFFMPEANESYSLRGLDVYNEVDWRVTETISLNTALGISFLREEQVGLSTGSNINSKLSPAPFAALSLKFFLNRR